MAYRRTHDSRTTTPDLEGSDLFTYMFWDLLYNAAVSDNWGRFDANLRVLRSKAFPQHTDQVELQQIETALQFYAERTMVRLYFVRGHRLGQIVNFDAWQYDTVRNRGLTGGQYPAEPCSEQPAERAAPSADGPSGILAVYAEAFPGADAAKDRGFSRRLDQHGEEALTFALGELVDNRATVKKPWSYVDGILARRASGEPDERPAAQASPDEPLPAAHRPPKKDSWELPGYDPTAVTP